MSFDNRIYEHDFREKLLEHMDEYFKQNRPDYQEGIKLISQTDVVESVVSFLKTKATVNHLTCFSKDMLKKHLYEYQKNKEEYDNELVEAEERYAEARQTVRVVTFMVTMMVFGFLLYNLYAFHLYYNDNNEQTKYLIDMSFNIAVIVPIVVMFFLMYNYTAFTHAFKWVFPYI